MDGFEAARIVFTRIQKVVEEPESASKIIGLLLLKEHGEQEMIRLACSPEAHLHSVILSLKSDISPSPLQLNQSRDEGEAEFLHKRSCSASDVSWTPKCLYFSRGFCKNGSACRFLHTTAAAADLDGLPFMDSPPSGTASEFMDQQRAHQLSRSKSFDPRFISGSPPGSSYLSEKYLNFHFLMQKADSPRSGDDLLDIRQTGLERSLFQMNAGMDTQIYLTFPADSSFREEDVSNYFSMYGLVQDVRIPYQQKRMFGFVTFLYPETVKIILAKGNPHFVCDARVLVKPYKEKGKVPDRYRNLQTLNRGDHFFMCNLGPRNPFDSQTFGSGMLSNQDILLRRKLEEHADIQQALELQSRRLMGMRLLDVNRQHHQRVFSMGGMAIPSPTRATSYYLNRSFGSSSTSSSPESTDDNFYSPPNGILPSYDPEIHLLNNLSVGASKEGTHIFNNVNSGVIDKDLSLHAKNGDLQQSAIPEHYLPENDKSSASIQSASPFSKNLTWSPFNSATSTLEMAKSCYFQLPRLSASHGAIEM